MGEKQSRLGRSARLLDCSLQGARGSFTSQSVESRHRWPCHSMSTREEGWHHCRISPLRHARRSVIGLITLAPCCTAGPPSAEFGQAVPANTMSPRPSMIAVAALFREDGSSDLKSVLSVGAFQLSPSNPAGKRRWAQWGSGAAGLMSMGEHDLRGRVRSATLGCRHIAGALTLGFTLSHSRGSGSTLPTGPIEA